MIDKISNLLKFDLSTYFSDYKNFIEVHNQELVNFYTVESDYPKDAFDSLDSLLSRSNEAILKFSINNESLTDYYSFTVFENIEDCLHSLEIINNYSRWLRSSSVNGRFKESSEIDFVLRQNQTIESMSREIGYIDKDQGSIDLSLRNSIKETDYDLNGGYIFKFSYQGEGEITINTIVDNIFGENLLGKDLSKDFIIVDNDLLYLTPRQTFLQTVSILTGLLKNDNPEFINQGFNKASISNKNSLSNTLPVFIRQLYSTVSGDDTVQSFRILKVENVLDYLSIEMEFTSHLNYEVKQTVNGN